MSEESAWVSTHENTPHVHEEERDAPQWIYWVLIGFSLGVLAYIAYEEWRASRKFAAEIEAWSVRARALLAEKAKAVAVQEVSDETPAATTSEAL